MLRTSLIFSLSGVPSGPALPASPLGPCGQSQAAFGPPSAGVPASVMLRLGSRFPKGRYLPLRAGHLLAGPACRLCR